MFPHKTLNLEKIKDAIDALSDEEYEELEVWMASQDDEDEDEDENEDDVEDVDEGETLDPGDPRVRELVDIPAFSRVKSRPGDFY